MLLNSIALVAFSSVASAVATQQQIPFISDSRATVLADESFPVVTSLQDGTVHQLVSHADFPMHSMRIQQVESLCDTTVKSYSGYLDIANDKSLFFWLFESRGNPKKDPLALWLNGGPGCSSATGLLFELGPCAIANEGANTTFNEFSWNSNSNMLFLDSPVGVGYSYGDGKVSDSKQTAEDVYAFLQLLYLRFPGYMNNDFVVSGESYAGTYIPHIGSFIHASNLQLPTKSSQIIPLKSLLIGNGLTNSLLQFPKIIDHSCGDSKFAIFDEATCDSMASKVPTCEKLTQYCYDSPNRFTCVPATLSCWQIASPIQQSGKNPYDVRKTCDRDGADGPLCYRQMGWIETYLNKPEIKKALGVAQERTFESCNMEINRAFQFNGDVSHNTAALIPPMLEAGIKVLIYAGEADFMCNYLGNLAWTLDLEWSGKTKYNAAKEKSYRMEGEKKSKGNTRSFGPLTYLQVFDAGHMVPYDQPALSLDFFNKWINDVAFA